MRTDVKDVMAIDVVSVAEGATFKEIAEVMHRNGVRALPVLDAAGRVRGVVSASDLLYKEADPTAAEELFHLLPKRNRARRKAEATTAADLMSAPAVTASPTTTAEDAARIMRRHDIDQLPVIDPGDGRLVGIVSRLDLLGVYIRRDSEIQREIFAEILAGRFGLERRLFGVLVENGRVTLRGRLGRRSQATALLHAVRQVEGVVSARSALEFDIDDYPIAAP